MSNTERLRGLGAVGARAVGRLRAADLAWLEQRLSERDWAILEIANRLRLVRGDQLERLCFSSLSGRSREVSRGRVLHRLVRWHVLDMLPRRIGGASSGSSGSVFTLGLAGQRLLTERQAAAGQARRVRHVGPVTDRTTLHTLAVSELYVSLVEQARSSGAQVVTFAAEPACWWPNGLGGFVKPDAYAVLDSGDVRDHWWVEVDRATESLPTMKRKLMAYLDFVNRGQLGPENVIPRVMITVPNELRRDALRTVLGRLPEPASALFVVVEERRAALLMLASLKE